MSRTHGRVVILGLGLIGGSLARSLRATGFCQEIIGWGHREASLRRGVELGIIDNYSLNLQEAIADTDVIVVATPTLVAADMLRQLLPLLPRDGTGPVVTDVASVKGSLRQAAIEVTGGMPTQLVLGHPIAGSERSGVDASAEDLFQRHRVILTPEHDSDPGAVELVRRMWESSGAEVIDMDVDTHDAVLAATSHLPHVLAYALVDALAQSDVSENIFRFAAGGFRDFTRIASSDPVMWKDIALANREALLASLDEFNAHLLTLRAAIDSADAEALLATFTRAKAARDDFASSTAERDTS